MFWAFIFIWSFTMISILECRPSENIEISIPTTNLNLITKTVKANTDLSLRKLQAGDEESTSGQNTGPGKQTRAIPTRSTVLAKTLSKHSAISKSQKDKSLRKKNLRRRNAENIGTQTPNPGTPTRAPVTRYA